MLPAACSPTAHGREHCPVSGMHSWWISEQANACDLSGLSWSSTCLACKLSMPTACDSECDDIVGQDSARSCHDGRLQQPCAAQDQEESQTGAIAQDPSEQPCPRVTMPPKPMALKLAGASSDRSVPSEAEASASAPLQHDMPAGPAEAPRPGSQQLPLQAQRSSRSGVLNLLEGGTSLMAMVDAVLSSPARGHSRYARVPDPNPTRE